MRLIDADALIDKTDDRYSLGEIGRREHDDIVTALEFAPTIEAQPDRTGKWIYHPDWEADGECGYECSECGMGSDVDYNYCMRCGAKMLKEGE